MIRKCFWCSETIFTWNRFYKKAGGFLIERSCTLELAFFCSEHCANRALNAGTVKPLSEATIFTLVSNIMESYLAGRLSLLEADKLCKDLGYRLHDTQQKNRKVYVVKKGSMEI